VRLKTFFERPLGDAMGSSSCSVDERRDYALGAAGARRERRASRAR
jgi:hypothetical protein